MTRLLLASALVAAAVSPALSTPAHAQPCVTPPVSPTVSTCVLNFGPSGRGASVAVIGSGYAFVLVGCYYPGGQPRYYVGVGTSVTGLIHVDAPVGGLPCV
jgi:hypothetical protein